MRTKFLLALPALLILLHACDFGDAIGGGGGTGGQGLTGTIVDPQGVPVVGAKVRVFPELQASGKAASSPHEPMPDSQTTSGKGKFRFTNLAQGQYRLEALVQRGDTALVLVIRSINFVEKSLDLGTDTLRIAGGLRATIRTDGNVPVVGAACSLFDTPRSTVSDSSGTCVFSGLMPGAYRLRVASPGLIASEMDVVVVSGDIAEPGAVVLYSQGTDTAWTIRYQTTWTYFNSAAWSGNLLVAVGFRTAVYPEPTIGFIITSPDGINWTQRTSGTDQALADVVWTGSQFLVMAQRGIVLISPDGIEWTQHKVPDTTALLDAVAWSGTNFVIVGSGTTMTSPDGVTWTAHEQDPGFTRVIWAGTQFIAVDNSSSVATSPDGVVWTTRVAQAGSHIQDVAWGNGMMVAVGSEGILTSTDGITWVVRAPGTVGGYNVEWVKGRFIVDGHLWSSDGVNWQEESHNWRYLSRVWTGSRMVAVTNEGVASSP
jgi:hypothetical protein